MHDPRAASELVEAVLKRSGEACRGSSAACHAMGWIYAITGCGEYGVQECATGTAARARQRRKARALDDRYRRLLDAECDRGVASSCREIATGKDLKRAVKPYLRACELGDALSCDQLPAALSSYRHMSEDEHLKYVEMACTAGHPISCIDASKYWSDMDLRLSTSLRGRARELLRQGCPIGPPPDDRCSAERVLESLGRVRMYEFVVDALRRGCHGPDERRSCSYLVDALRVPRDSWTSPPDRAGCRRRAGSRSAVAHVESEGTSGGCPRGHVMSACRTASSGRRAEAICRGAPRVVLGPPCQ